jgi:hypothetical protein
MTSFISSIWIEEFPSLKQLTASPASPSWLFTITFVADLDEGSIFSCAVRLLLVMNVFGKDA